jgi:hypothetical protein
MANSRGGFAQRIRPNDSPEVRAARAELIGMAIVQTKKAIENGFYLEAIALLESLMADRIESILLRVQGEPPKLLTVSQGIKDLKSVGGQLVDEAVLEEIKVWSRGRSKWIHEFIKISDSEELPWEVRVQSAKEVAISGLALFNRLNASTKRFNRSRSR